MLNAIFAHSETPPSADALKRMQAHAALLAKWNRTHNLTALPERDWPEVHFFDSWLAVPLAHKGALIDVGSGGGFPGLVLLAETPAREAVFFEKVEKKRAFLRTAIATLGYTNARVATQEFPATNLPAGTFVSRATWAPEEWLRIAASVAKPGDIVITQAAAEPAPQAPAGWQREVVETILPLSKAPRTLARFVFGAD